MSKLPDSKSCGERAKELRTHWSSGNWRHVANEGLAALWTIAGHLARMDERGGHVCGDRLNSDADSPQCDRPLGHRGSHACEVGGWSR